MWRSIDLSGANPVPPAIMSTGVGPVPIDELAHRPLDPQQRPGVDVAEQALGEAASRHLAHVQLEQLAVMRRAGDGEAAARPSSSRMSRYWPGWKGRASTAGRRRNTCMTSGASGARRAMRQGRVLISTSDTLAMSRASTTQIGGGRAWHRSTYPAWASCSVSPRGRRSPGVPDLPGFSRARQEAQ